jgi:hypothetical protein
MHATPALLPARSLRSPHILSLLARCTATTAYTSAVVASSTTPASRTVSGADRWRRFLSSISLEAAAFGFDGPHRGSIAAKQWRVRAPAWANPAIES